jgi:hypothetical protein
LVVVEAVQVLLVSFPQRYHPTDVVLGLDPAVMERPCFRTHDAASFIHRMRPDPEKRCFFPRQLEYAGTFDPPVTGIAAHRGGSSTVALVLLLLFVYY